MKLPRNINQIINLPASRRVGDGGKNRAIPSWGLALESTPSESALSLTPTLRRVTLTNLIAGPLAFRPGGRALMMQISRRTGSPEGTVSQLDVNIERQSLYVMSIIFFIFRNTS